MNIIATSIRRSSGVLKLSFLRSQTRFKSLDLEEDDGVKMASQISLGSQEFKDQPFTIEGAFDGGFIFSNFTVSGPLLILPQTLLRWNVYQPEDIKKENLGLPTILHPKIEILLLGTGNSIFHLKQSIIEEINRMGPKIVIEDTRTACGTYNLLRQQDYQIAACMIPLNKKEIKTINKSYITKKLK